ncbi:hypothetical protein BDZ91DRAFT_641590, partial [Kalaharituber pfeilii]
NAILCATSVPPRRLWDVFADRVIFSCMRGHVTKKKKKKKKKKTQTPVNAYQWPVPFPSSASYAHLRPLLRLDEDFLGARFQYSWLDVICLRQSTVGSDLQYNASAERLRLKEWEVDVPTIGNIYRNASIVVRFFNGLGRPFDDSEQAWANRRHWTKRAWTLQEIRPQQEMVDRIKDQYHIIGPHDKSRRSAIIRDRLAQISELAAAVHSSAGCSVIRLGTHMAQRYATNPVDKIAGINYLIWPRGRTFNLPIYDPSADMEDVWLTCVQSMRGELKLELLFLFPWP